MEILLVIGFLATAWQRPAPATASAALEPELELTNLELAIGYATIQVDERLVVTVEERAQRADLNGDGDRNDTVPHFVPIAGGAPVGLGLAGSLERVDRPQVFSGNVVLSLSEPGQGRDYNGDGDQLDHIEHVVDASTLRTVDLGLGAALSVGRADVAFTSAYELSAGDLNGDGDRFDWVTFRFDLVTGAGRRIVDGLVYDVLGDELLLYDDESSQDRNGDGDRDDRFFLTYDLTTGAVETRKVLLTRNASWQVLDRRVFTSPFELELGDLNLDGDRLDRVLHVFDLERNESVNLGRSGDPALAHRDPWTFGFLPDTRGGASTLHVFDEDLLRLVPVTEDGGRAGAFAPQDVVAGALLEAGRDRNGDGDGTDRVPAVHDLRARARKVLPFALADPPSVHSGADPIWQGGQALAFAVGESEQGADLNADGDRDDRLLHLHSLDDQRTVSTGLPLEPQDDIKVTGDSWFLWPGPTSFLFPISEEREQRDLNGDGDLVDAVLHVAALESGARLRRANLGFDYVHNDSPEFYGPFLRRRWIAFVAEERSDGRDLDGDGIVGTPGTVPQFHHLPSGATLNLGLLGVFLVVREDVALVLVYETAHTGDLNGDGDADDSVLFRVDLHETG